MKRMIKKICEFENKSGIAAWEEFKVELNRLNMKFEQLKISRDNWKKKYFNLKKPQRI